MKSRLEHNLNRLKIVGNKLIGKLPVCNIEVKYRSETTKWSTINFETDGNLDLVLNYPAINNTYIITVTKDNDKAVLAIKV
jgi:hypothetical protein